MKIELDATPPDIILTVDGSEIALKHRYLTGGERADIIERLAEGGLV